MAHFRRLIGALCLQNVDFVLTGGMAAVIHGASYVRQVMGICYSRVGPNPEKLCLALAPLNPRLRGVPKKSTFVWNALTLQAGSQFPLTTDAGSLDLLGELPGLGDYNRVNEYAESVEIEGHRCRVLSLEALILTKKASPRTRDRLLVPELEALLALRKKQSRKVSG